MTRWSDAPITKWPDDSMVPMARWPDGPMPRATPAAYAHTERYPWPKPLAIWVVTGRREPGGGGEFAAHATQEAIFEARECVRQPLRNQEIILQYKLTHGTMYASVGE
jgi:hypothetical protein